uniref:Uncharacterized protein n=1 Tax=Anguilla anguilla TaxID=7936 RepID=A0A0E9W2W8_ANGAN
MKFHSPLTPTNCQSRFPIYVQMYCRCNLCKSICFENIYSLAVGLRW